jgi:serine/threonine protein kinase
MASQEEAITAYQSEIAAYQTTIASQEEEIAAYQTTIASQEEAIAAYKATIALQEEELARSQRESAQELATARRELTRSEEARSQSTQELARSQRESAQNIARLQSQLTRVEQELATARRELTRAEVARRQSTQNNARLQAELTRSEEALSQHSLENTRLRQQLAEASPAPAHSSEPALLDALNATTLGDFLVHQRLGARSRMPQQFYGCNSAVYEATLLQSPGLGSFALKALLASSDLNTPALWEEFQQDFAVADARRSRLPRHRNIARVLHTFDDDLKSLPEGLERPFDAFGGDARERTLFVVSKRFGIALNTFLQEEHARCHAQGGSTALLDEALFFELATQLCAGVSHLNAHRVVHRDLKPDNIMLDGEAAALYRGSTLKIIDFGMALDCKELDYKEFQMPFTSRHVPRGGAPLYLAPEVMTSRPGRGVVIDYAHNDAWAVGLILDNMLRVRVDQSEPAAFQTQSHAQMNANLRIPLPAGYSPAVRELVEGLLQTDPGQRLSIQQAWARAYTGFAYTHA